MPFTGRVIPGVVNEYGGMTAPIAEYVEPTQPSSEQLRMTSTELKTKTGWSDEDIELATAQLGFPKCHRALRTRYGGRVEAVFTWRRDEVQRWLERCQALMRHSAGWKF